MIFVIPCPDLHAKHVKIIGIQNTLLYMLTVLVLIENIKLTFKLCGTKNGLSKLLDIKQLHFLLF
jgi:hypothetical protein